MTDLTELITLWIGEERYLPQNECTGFTVDEVNCYRDGYNQALKDLKSRIPDLTKQIDKWHEDKGYSCVAHSEGQDCCLDILLESINKTEKAFSEMTDILRGRNMKIEQEIMEMFDEKFPAEVITFEDGQGRIQSTLITLKSIKSFISHIITLVQKREREEIVERIWALDIETYTDANFIRDEIIDLIKQND